MSAKYKVSINVMQIIPIMTTKLKNADKIGPLKRKGRVTGKIK